MELPRDLDDQTVCGRLSERSLLALLFLLALGARLPGIASDLSIDEIATLVGFVRRPLSELLVTYGSANNHVLYSILAHISVGVFGETSWALRLPAVLFGAATAPALYVLARLYLRDREALVAAVILALSYHHAYFSQIARGYSGMLFFAVLSTALLQRALRKDSTRDWAAYTAVTVTSIYLLLSSVFVCIAQFIGALCNDVMLGSRELRRHRFNRLVTWVSLAALLTAVVYAPLMVSFLDYYTTVDDDAGWRPSLQLLVVFVRDLAPNRLTLFGGALAVPVAIAGMVSLWRRAPLVFFAFALPPLIEFGITMAMGVGTFPRRFVLVIPLALLVAVRGASLAGDLVAWLFNRAELSRPVFAALAFGGLAVAAAGLPRLYTLPKQDYTGALALVEQRRRPGDIVAAAYLAELGTQFYDPGVRSARQVSDLQALLAEDRRIWLIGTFREDMQKRAPQLDALIAERFSEVACLPSVVGDGEMIIWTNQPK